MVVNCAVPACKNKWRRYSPTRFFRLPLQDRQSLTLWLVALKLHVNTPVEQLHKLRVCSDHFRDDDYSRPVRKPQADPSECRFLKKHAVPSVAISGAQSRIEHSLSAMTATGTDEEIKYEIAKVEIKEEMLEQDCSVESLDGFIPKHENTSDHAEAKNLVLKEEPENKQPVTVNHHSVLPCSADEPQSCRMSCRGQQALDKHLLEKHSSCFVKDEGELAPSQFGGPSLPIVSITILPGALWTGECSLAFHHCPKCRQSFQCLNTHSNSMFTQRRQADREERLGEVAVTLFHCVKCEWTFPHKELLKAHHLTHTETMPYSCTDCGSAFAQDDSLELRSKSQTLSRAEHTPDQCSTSDGSLRLLHRAKGSSQEHAVKYFCNECDMDFRLLSRLHDHEKMHHSRPVHICADCGKSFRQFRNLLRHQRIHTGETPYPCKYCGKRFSQVGSLKLHQRSHTGETPYQCTFCEKSFSQLENLKRHRRTHTGETPYACKECGKSFSQLGNLKAHLRIHTGETPFTCSMCGKGFKNKGNLKAHCRIHTGETPFHCEDCGKTFGWLAALKTHQRTHTGERPYRCERCGESFAYSYKLHSHGCQG